MRNASKCFLCFRPPATLEIDEDGVDCSADRMLSLIAAARSSNRLNKKPEKKKPLPKDNTADRPASSRKTFSGVVKAVMFQNSLSRRLRDARSRSRSDQSSNSPTPTPDQTTAVEESAMKTESNQAVGNNNNNNSLCRVKENRRDRALVMNPVVCLVLLSLCVTVFWGRACAVLLTTVWIYAWQSGAVVAGWGEMMKKAMVMRRIRRRRKRTMRAGEGRETEKLTDRVTAKGKQSIERGFR